MDETQPQSNSTLIGLMGAISGDIIGSRFEAHPHKSIDFELFTSDSRFTDDSVLTIAIADAILSGRSYEDSLLDYGRRYPRAGYGAFFRQWLSSTHPRPYNSFGNGSAMRVSPVAWGFGSVPEVLQEALRSAEPTHNHLEGIKGAQAVALAIYLAREGEDKEDIRYELYRRFGYNLDFSIDQLRPTYIYDITCQGTVPPALVAFFESSSFEEAIRLAVSLGGDSDTLAAITGSIAEAYYGGIPELIVNEVKSILPAEFWSIIEAFSAKYGKNNPRRN
jgi:ADP-ribosylglycohydrolase